MLNAPWNQANTHKNHGLIMGCTFKQDGAIQSKYHKHARGPNPAKNRGYVRPKMPKKVLK